MEHDRAVGAGQEAAGKRRLRIQQAGHTRQDDGFGVRNNSPAVAGLCFSLPFRRQVEVLQALFDKAVVEQVIDLDVLADQFGL